MSGLFANTVSALCYDIARSQVAPCETSGNFNDVTSFVMASWHRMPRFLAWPIRLATVLFTLSSIVSAGGLYYRLPPQRRWTILESWRYSRLGSCRDLVRFYHSLATLAVYSRKANRSQQERWHETAPTEAAIEAWR
jgi:hypothetical protein